MQRKRSSSCRSLKSSQYIRLGGCIGAKKISRRQDPNPGPKPLIVFGEDGFFTEALGKALQQHRMRLARAGASGSASIAPLSWQPPVRPCANRTGAGRRWAAGHPRRQQGGRRTVPRPQQIQDPQPGPVGKCPKNRLRLGWNIGFHIRLYEYIGCSRVGQVGKTGFPPLSHFYRRRVARIVGSTPRWTGPAFSIH